MQGVKIHILLTKLCYCFDYTYEYSEHSVIILYRVKCSSKLGKQGNKMVTISIYSLLQQQKKEYQTGAQLSYFSMVS